MPNRPTAEEMEADLKKIDLESIRSHHHWRNAARIYLGILVTASLILLTFGTSNLIAL